MQERRVVITGLGAITPLGNTIEEYWNNLIDGVNGIGPITHFDPTDHQVKIAAEVIDFDPLDFMDGKSVSRRDPYAQYAIAAAKNAWENSGINMGCEDPEDVGVIIGTGIGGVRTWEEGSETLFSIERKRLSPFFVQKVIPNMSPGHISIMIGARGPNMTIATACASGNHAIGEAFYHIINGRAKVMVAGGAEAAIEPLSIAGFGMMKALSLTEDYEFACRPFDIEHNGFVMGEGSGILILEDLEHAKTRGAHIYAEVVGYGSSADADNEVLLNARGPVSSMKKAMICAKINPSNIEYINAHGTSTKAGDRGETEAIKIAFGEFAKKVMISSTKSMIGHLLGAAGAIEAIACVMALQKGVIPATRNLHNPDPECDLDYVPNTAREISIKYAMNNSFGFGGQNACTIFKRFTD